MKLYTKKEECCGCGVCYSMCPVGAIVMQEDERGFQYPVIKEEKCIGCLKCVKVCALKARRNCVYGERYERKKSNL